MQERQTHALDRAAIEIGTCNDLVRQNIKELKEISLCTTELLKSAYRRIIRSIFLFCVVNK
jgi:hypothetical protein